MREQGTKSQHLLTLGVASLGGAATLILFSLSELEAFADSVFFSIVGAGAIVNVQALWLFTRSCVGRGFEGSVIGPSPEWLRTQLERGRIPADVQAVILASTPLYYHANRRLITRLPGRGNVGFASFWVPPSSTVSPWLI